MRKPMRQALFPALAALAFAALLAIASPAAAEAGGAPCWSAEDARAAALIWNPTARLEERLAGPEADALIALFNRTPPATAYRADAIEVWGLPGSAHVVLFTYWRGCFAPITPKGAPLCIRDSPFTCGQSACGGRDEIGPAAIRFSWAVTVPEPRVAYFRCGAGECGVTPLLAIRRADDLECVLHRLKPAHTSLIVSYLGA